MRCVQSRSLSLVLLACVWSVASVATATPQGMTPAQWDRFRQLDEWLPTPTDIRTASGAPGFRYWQQSADYQISVSLDEDTHLIRGRETVTYRNRSPDPLRYLWVQLDNNIFDPKSKAARSETAPDFQHFPYRGLARLLEMETFNGRLHLDRVRARGKTAKTTVVDTMMRIDLDRTLMPGEKIVLEIAWHYQVNDTAKVRSRTGYELFDDKNAIYEIAHWYPRMAAYTDYNGWQHHSFLGRGEFTLEFGDFDVEITVPADHVVAATGTLQNAKQVLTGKQRSRLAKAARAKNPVYVVTSDEAKAASKKRSKKTKTWRFKAKNVRDFAWASSRKFIWDAQGTKVGNQTVTAMSYYPPEAEPLWNQYSTRAVVHTLDVYGRYTFDYPYPVAISVNGPVGGMEYPMICFNGPRPEDDKTYYDVADGEGKRWDRTKYGLISVIIHEVGHNFFPMIVNSDERQWTWMDEGLNTFLQYLSEVEWEEKYPTWRGEPKDIVAYMRAPETAVPIMTQSDSILQFGNNAYGKPATALNILRETVMGRELFDFAFKEFARRWKFKRPTPSDFFRTMEDASGVDLDWFWRGWFYGTDPVDVAVVRVRQFTMDTRNPDIDKPSQKKEDDALPRSVSDERNAPIKKFVTRVPEAKDFYNSYDKWAVTSQERDAYKKLLEGLDDWEKELLATERNFYVIDFANRGGLVSPILLELHFKDGSIERQDIPAEIWRRNPKFVSRLVMTKKDLTRVVVDPRLQTADINIENNFWPRRAEKSRFQLFKETRKPNAMQQERDAKKAAEEKAKEEKKKAAGKEGKGK